MLADDAFDGAVAGFYQAAAGETSWGDALRPVQAALSAWLITLTGIDTVRGTMVFSHEVGNAPPEAQLDYLRTYHRIDPHARVIFPLAPLEWIRDTDHFDDDFVANDPYHQEFLIPYGCRHIAGTKLLQEGNLCVMFGIHVSPGSGPLNPVQERTCMRLATHLSDAIRLYRRRVAGHFTNTLAFELLQRMRSPMALIDAQRRVVQANPAAQALFDRGDTLYVGDGTLRSRRPADDAAMLFALRDLQLVPDGQIHGGPSSEKTYCQARSTGRGKGRLGVFLYALRPESTMGAFGAHSLALVMLHDPDANPLALDPYVLAAGFDLTPAEARAAVGLAQGMSPDDIATAHGVALNTLRTRMRSIFKKTRTSGQSELVSLLTSAPMAALDLGASVQGVTTGPMR